VSSQQGWKIPRAVDILAIVFFVSIATAVALVVFIALNLPATETGESIAGPTAAVELLATTTLAPATIPGFGPITFSIGLHGDPTAGSAASFPAGTTEVYATWGYENMQPGTPYRLSWYRDNTPWSNQPYAWDTEQHGSHGTAYHTPIVEHDADGLPPGNYRLELFIGERQAQVATFAIEEPIATELASPNPSLGCRQGCADVFGASCRSIRQRMVPGWFRLYRRWRFGLDPDQLARIGR
jgi:hypothetical protein